MDLILEAPSSHLYPGLVGRIEAEGLAEALRRGARCAVAFSDGAFAAARLGAASDGTHELAVEGYRTQRGTSIPAKRWRLTVSLLGTNDASFRVAGRLA